jgi:hypothetical protein
MDEESFDKEVMSWADVKCNPCKFGMHYLFPLEILKKKGQEEGVKLSSGPIEKKQKVHMPSYSK